MDRLDSDLLRSFLAVSEAGSFTKGAETVFRSQSAVSLQIKRLEQILGGAVFERHARGVQLSDIGARLHPVALRVVELLDRTQKDLSAAQLGGRLAIGIPDEYGETALPSVIARFAQQHPAADLTVRCGFSAGFPDALAKGKLDLAVYAAETPPAGSQILRRERALWMASKHHLSEEKDPLPLALFDRTCWWRDRALEALEAAGRRYRVVFTSESAAGVKAAITSGTAVGVLAEGFASPELRVLPESASFPALLGSALVLVHRDEATSDLAAAMQDAIVAAFAND